jgi:enoyl-CoA hydratase
MSVVLYESRDGIATITINRPGKRNALSDEVVERLHEAWNRFEASQDRVAVLNAAGSAAFSAGADLNAIPHDLWRSIPGAGVDVTKPVIMAAQGWIVGGAMLFAMAADLLVVSETATFVYPEAKIGFSGGLIAALASRIPHKIAMEVILLGENLSAQRAYEAGFVNKITPPGKELEAALDYARKLAANAPLVLNLLKGFVNQTLPKGPAEHAAKARREIEAINASSDLCEGAAAFREKRAPRFTGS